MRWVTHVVIKAAQEEAFKGQPHYLSTELGRKHKEMVSIISRLLSPQTVTVRDP